MTPASKIAALTAELAETREAAASLIAAPLLAVSKSPEERKDVALVYEGIANGRNRSRVMGVLCRMVAKRLRAG